MTETQNGQQPNSFKLKLGNTTYTVKVHFSKVADKTFKDRVQKLIINECLEKTKNNTHLHFTTPLEHPKMLTEGIRKTYFVARVCVFKVKV